MRRTKKRSGSGPGVVLSIARRPSNFLFYQYLTARDTTAGQVLNKFVASHKNFPYSAVHGEEDEIEAPGRSQ
jgi:hypothetical protein